MLPRVSAALAQFVAPIAVSATSSQQKAAEGKPSFERFKPGQKKKQDSRNSGDQQPPSQDSGTQGQNPGAQVIPLPLAPKAAGALPEGESKALPAGVSQALLQLMGLLHEQRASILRWLGVGTYQNAARQQKKNGRVRKGTIIDEQAG